MTTNAQDMVYYVNSESGAEGKVTYSVVELPRGDAQKVRQLDARLRLLQRQLEGTNGDNGKASQALEAEAALTCRAHSASLSKRNRVSIVTNGNAFRRGQVIEKSMIHMLRSSKARRRN